jgi:tRNA G46 methylase TrmB
MRIVSDVEEYAAHVREVMMPYSEEGWNLVSEECAEPCERSVENLRPITRYELKAKELGHKVWDFQYCFIPKTSLS